ncbi:MAG TPA: RNase A-like domain-containing protein [Burkholderiaceae bacterium]
MFGEHGSVGHLLAHGALGALAEAARGGDPMAGALGAMTATLIERPLDDALGLSGTAQGHALLTALSMMAGGAVADAAGGDPLAGAFSAQNVTLFNFLKHPEQDRYASAKNACAGDAACLQAVDADFGQLSQANKQALAEARVACETTGFCTDYYRLMTEAMPLGMGAQLPGGIDPENPWLGAQQNADAIAYNLALFDRLMARPLSAEVVRQDFTPDPEAYQFAPQGSSHYVGANSAQNIDKVVVLSAAGASLLLPGPEDLAVGAVLTTQAGQFVARVIEVGGQKLLRWADGSVGSAAKGATPFSDIVPGGGLAAHEAAGGHLIARHVGQTETALAARLTAQPRIGAASTFVSRQEAEAAISGALRAKASDVDAWVATGSRGRLVIDSPFNGGRVLQRGAASVVPGTGVRVVLEGTGGGTWRIITGYPIP